jgi:hypothetical protein
MTYILVFLTAALLAFPVHAQNQNNTINVNIPPEFKDVGAEYNAAIEKLSPAQRAYLDTVLKENVTTLEPDIEVVVRQVLIEPCVKQGLFNKGHNISFMKFRDHQTEKQGKLREQFKKTYIDDVDFIDQQLLMRRLGLEEAIQMQIVAGTASIAAKSRNPEESRRECAKLTEFLDMYVSENRL